MQQLILDNDNGMRVLLTNLGARIMRIQYHGVDLVLGFDSPHDYLPQNNLSDFGALVGRYANRLADGRITVDGHAYQLPQNNGPNCLHGGPNGWQYALFDVVEASSSHVRMSLVSPDGDSGFPGQINLTVDYSLSPDNCLRIDYLAHTDRPTVINLTNHSYFNLSGDLSTTIHDHILSIDASRYSPVNEVQIPFNDHCPVAHTPFDFRQPKPIGRDIDADDPQLLIGRGYDHNFLLDSAFNGSLDHPQASLFCPRTGISLLLFTTAPGLQLYTGNYLGSMAGRGNVVFPRRGAVCLETQLYPDSPNHHWPESSGFLYPDKPFSSTTIFRFCHD